MQKLIVLSCTIVMAVIAQEQPRIPCGLPPFVAHFPEKQKKELMDVWLSYKTGEDCSEQQRSTFDIVRSLTDQERMAVFKPELHLPNFENSRGKFNIIPEFIKTLTPEIKQGFDDIWTQINIGETESRKLEEYVKEKFTPEQKAGFEEWMEQIKKNRKEVDERIKHLSPKAKELLRELIKIRANEGKILQQVTPQLATELYGFI